ncbi:MAG: aldehyde dehydrogenase family protein [Bacteroidia bacterium]|nr:aldehyde dehydrogenase family protein [Bacteroidia bacterium]
MSITQDLKELDEIVKHIKERGYYSKYTENIRSYSEEYMKMGETAFHKQLNSNFNELYASGCANWIGEEVSPYLNVGLGIHYPAFDVKTLVLNAQQVKNAWAKTSLELRTKILLESLDVIAERFSEIAYATMHTTGQSFLMSFQASGPHALDRAMEAIVMGYVEQSRYNAHTTWTKNLGKFDLTLEKNYKAIPKGIGLLIGCSTFPIWNSFPGLYADLITGNVAILKPHPKAIYPIAIVISEIQKVLEKYGFDKRIVQIAVDTVQAPITKVLCEQSDIKLIDYTGGNAFGDYVESLVGKETFTEKAGVNSIILDSSNDLQKTAQNIAFSISLYSGQMCTAPQNIFVAEQGISTPNGIVGFDEFKTILSEAIKGLVTNPKAGAATLGAIQNDFTLERVKKGKLQFSDIVLDTVPVENPEFEAARVQSPIVVAVESAQKDLYWKEYFGPFVVLIKTKNFEESLQLAAQSARENGAITCLAYCTDAEKSDKIEDVMNNAFTPVSFNFSGAAFVNQHAAFSDLHVTGGNPAGNATFTDPNFINKRFVWVGNRYMKE